MSAEHAHLKLSFLSLKVTVPEADLICSVLWMVFGLGPSCFMYTMTLEDGGYPVADRIVKLAVVYVSAE